MTDYFGADASSLKEKKLWLLDLDGTIYEENRLFDGTKQLLDKIYQLSGRAVYLTNNSSKSIDEYIEKLRGFGINVSGGDVFSSTNAAVLLLNDSYAGCKVYCQGTKSFVGELRDAGIDVTESVEDVDLVLVGFDTELTSQKLSNTCEILSKQDVVFLATNPDLVCPVSFGFVPDCGSICGMIYNATGKRPIFIGKPEPVMIETVCSDLGFVREETVVVGDRLYTDIKSGINAGITTICVLSGEAGVDDIVSGDIRPTFTFGSVRDIYNAL